MSETELKPCPFCGGKAVFLVKSHTEHGFNRGWLFGISCINCGVALPKSNYKIETSFEANGAIKVTTDEREIAIQAWNRRANENDTE